jgi:hypothetical protein
MKRTTLIIMLASALIGGCNAATSGPEDESTAAGTCLAEAPDCEDDVEGGADLAPVEPERGVAVADAFDQNIDGAFELRGFFFVDETGARLCELLAESFPPQCGGASVPVGDFAVDLALNSESGVSWTDEVVYLEGELVGGVFQPLR